MAMSPRQYSEALKALGLTVASQRTAKLLGFRLTPKGKVNVRQSQRYASGDAVVPEPIERLLQMYLKHGTNEHKKLVRIGGEEIVAINVTGNLWDAAFPWGVERVISDADELVATVRARFRKKMAALDGD